MEKNWKNYCSLCVSCVSTETMQHSAKSDKNLSIIFLSFFFSVRIIINAFYFSINLKFMAIFHLNSHFMLLLNLKGRLICRSMFVLVFRAPATSMYVSPNRFFLLCSFRKNLIFRIKMNSFSSFFFVSIRYFYVNIVNNNQSLTRYCTIYWKMLCK